MDGGKRRAIRLGKVSKKHAEGILTRVEYLIAAKSAGMPLDGETARWLASLDDELHERIARVGLTDARVTQATVTLHDLFTAFNADARHDIKASTRTRQEQAQRHLLDFFGEHRDADSIGPDEADAWRSHLLDAKYAHATVAKSVQLARQFYSWALRRRMVESNPFSEVRAGTQTNAARLVFVSRDDIAKVMDEAPTAQWRLLIALSRFGGLRVPSEAFMLRWQDIDFSRMRMFVRSPKTERHANAAGRHVPIFPELAGLLLSAFEEAGDGAERVLSDFRPGTNPNTQLRRLIVRAGLKPWPRTWHNLRASRQSELVSEFPIATACAWLGNSRLVAAGHYITQSDADWQRAIGGGAESGAPATQKATQHTPAPIRTESGHSPEASGYDGVMRNNAKQGEGWQTPGNGRYRTRTCDPQCVILVR